jgi:hypothetical protein
MKRIYAAIGIDALQKMNCKQLNNQPLNNQTIKQSHDEMMK